MRNVGGSSGKQASSQSFWVSCCVFLSPSISLYAEKECSTSTEVGGGYLCFGKFDDPMSSGISECLLALSVPKNPEFLSETDRSSELIPSVTGPLGMVVTLRNIQS